MMATRYISPWRTGQYVMSVLYIWLAAVSLMIQDG